MAIIYRIVWFIFGILIVTLDKVATTSGTFDDKYVVTWGGDHVKNLDNGRLVQLSMDKSSGSGFSSKMDYSSGLFHFSIKTASKDTAGVVTAFYLSSTSSSHDELDFEFLGNREGKPVTLQTNIFTNGHGNREQRIHLWFDPSKAFHEYKILWNPYQIVFFVDDIPIRVYRNQISRRIEYPFRPMKVYVSLWNGEDWATNGGKDKTNWAAAPFITEFQDFNVDGCVAESKSCSSSSYWWNAGMYKQLTPTQQLAYQNVRRHYVTYDYCSDRQRFSVQPPECHL